MTIVELKNKVISKINQMNDDSLLTEIYKLLDTKFDDSDVYQLSDLHKIVVEEAKAQISRGEYLTNEQSDNEIDEWLNK
jgi:predicted transcriptional regulator